MEVGKIVNTAFLPVFLFSTLPLFQSVWRSELKFYSKARKYVDTLECTKHHPRWRGFPTPPSFRCIINCGFYYNTLNFGQFFYRFCVIQMSPRWGCALLIPSIIFYELIVFKKQNRRILERFSSESRHQMLRTLPEYHSNCPNFSIILKIA